MGEIKMAEVLNGINVKKDDITIQIFFIIREKDELSNTHIYSSVCFNIPNELRTTIRNKYIDQLNALSDLFVVDFDIISSEMDTIESIEYSGKDDIESILNLIDENDAQRISDIEFDINSIWGYAISIKNKKSDNYLIFRKYTFSKSVNENTKISFLNGNLQEVKQDIISIDYKIDAISYNNKIYVVNKFYFEQFFSYNERYIEYVRNSLDELRITDVIDNFDGFASRCLESNSLIRKLVYVTQHDRLKWLKVNIKTAQHVIEEFGLKVKVHDGKILYNDKSSRITDVMKLITGCCVKDAVDMHKYFASSVKEVK